MKDGSPFRLKSSRTACALLMVFFLANTHVWAAPAPILDVAMSGRSAMVDKSKFRRKLEMPQLSPGSKEDAVLLGSGRHITIPFEEKDPLFAQGPCTWMMRCQIMQIQVDRNGYLLAGRWTARDDQRIIMLSLPGKSGQPLLQVSSVGGLEGRSFVKLKSQVPEGEWVTIVGRFDPGTELALQVFDENGELLDNAVSSKEIPGDLPNYPLPFTIGRGVPSEMEFTRFRAWNSALSDSDIKTAVAEK